MHTCVISEYEAGACVQDCHAEGQSCGLEQGAEGCNKLIAAKSQPADCCCSVCLFSGLMQTQSTSAGLSDGVGCHQADVSAVATLSPPFGI